MNNDDRQFLIKLRKKARREFDGLDLYVGLVLDIIRRNNLDLGADSEGIVIDFLFNADITTNEFISKLK